MMMETACMAGGTPYARHFFMLSAGGAGRGRTRAALLPLLGMQFTDVFSEIFDRCTQQRDCANRSDAIATKSPIYLIHAYMCVGDY